MGFVVLWHPIPALPCYDIWNYQIEHRALAALLWNDRRADGSAVVPARTERDLSVRLFLPH